MTETTTSDLTGASSRALEIRALYEVLEQRFTGATWTLPELMVGFSNDVGHIGRLMLAHGGVWPIEGDVTAQLRHKLAESLWWTFVLADKLGVDIDSAFAETMDSIQAGLEATIARTEPADPTNAAKTSAS